MNTTSVRTYLRHYGKIKTLRASLMRSTFGRVQAGFDSYSEGEARAAMKALGQDDLENLSCVYCGKRAHCWDHLIPASRGGSHQLRNLAPACSECNISKGAKTWEEFLDDLPESEQVRWARQVLTEHVALLQKRDRCVSQDTTEQLDRILQQITDLMEQADQLIAADLVKSADPQ